MADPATYRPAPGSIPESPGVYRFRDARGRVIYVGKAKSLRQRLNSYFADFASLHPRTQAMLTSAASVDWTVVSTEVEALQLEYSWIKEFDPRYNVKYRDDKSYPYLAVTMSEEYPRVMVMRGAKRKGTRYFGPYSHAWAIRDTVDTLLRVFPVRTCSAGVFKRAGQIGRPCLLGYIGKCSAPCVERVSAAEHRELAEDFCDFMAGQTARFIRRIEAEMRQAAAAEEYERAARLRDDLRALERALEKQAVVLRDGTDCDVIALAEDQLEAAVQIFYVRDGRVRGQRGWVLEKVEDVTTGELVENFLGQVYGETPVNAPDSGPGAADSPGSGVPREILVPVLPPEPETVAEWLAVRRGGPVSLRVPRRGDKKALLDTVERNAMGALALHKTRRASDLTTRSRALHEIQEALGLDDAPLRIECYDVSNLQGTNVVASMVVFEDGLARKSEYRRFSHPRRRWHRRHLRYLRGDHPPVPALPGRTRGNRGAGHPGRSRAGSGGQCRRTGRGDAPAQVRVSAQSGGRRRRPGAGGRGLAGPERSEHRRRRRVRAGQAPGRGLAAGGGVPGHPAAQQRGALPAAAGPGRGAPVRDHLPSAEAVPGLHRERARRYRRPRAGPAGGPAQAVRLGPQAVRGDPGGDCGGARNRAAPGRDHRRRAAHYGGGPVNPVREHGGAAAAAAAPDDPVAPDIVVITGMSGAGRSTAAKSLEDLGWFVVDNLPPGLLPTMVDLAERSNGAVPKIAAVVDVRSRAFTTDLKSSIDGLGARGVASRIVFLEAADETLVQRFDSVRRPHPLQSSGRVVDGIAAERELLRDVRGEADLILDTSRLNVHELRGRMRDFFGGRSVRGPRVSIVSFGYKYGLPVDADLVVDCRFLPNPHWIPELAPMTGLDEPVREYVLSRPGAQEFLKAYFAALEVLLAGDEREGKHFVTLAVGCTGGKHRSVAIAEYLAAQLGDEGSDVRVTHRDLGRE